MEDCFKKKIKAMKTLEKFKKIKKYSDKHQFTIKFRLLDAPLDTLEGKKVATFFLESGIKRYINLLFFNKKGNHVTLLIEREESKRHTPLFSLIVEGKIKDQTFRVRIPGIEVGHNNVITLTFGNSMHVRMNNRAMTKDIDLLDFNDGYRLYEFSDAKTSDGWMFKML